TLSGPKVVISSGTLPGQSSTTCGESPPPTASRKHKLRTKEAANTSCPIADAILVVFTKPLLSASTLQGRRTAAPFPSARGTWQGNFGVDAFAVLLTILGLLRSPTGKGTGTKLIYRVWVWTPAHSLPGIDSSPLPF